MAGVAGPAEKVDALVGVIQAPMVEMMQVMAEYGCADQEQIGFMLSYMSEYTKASLEREGDFGGGMIGRLMGGSGSSMMSGAGPSGQGSGGMMGRR